MLGLHEPLDELLVLQEDLLCISTEESVIFLHIGLLRFPDLFLHSDSLVHICFNLEVLLDVASEDNLAEFEPIHFEFFDSDWNFIILSLWW